MGRYGRNKAGIECIKVVPAGAKVFVKVTRVTRSGMFGRAEKLEFTVDRVKAANGVEIPLEYTAERKRHNDGGAVVSILGGALMRGQTYRFLRDQFLK